MTTCPVREPFDPVLAVNGVDKSFRGKKALSAVEFTVPLSSFTVLLGPAGAGKTTTLRLIAGLDTPDGGGVVLSGNDVTGWEPRDRNVAMIFDNLALYPDKTGFENIASPLAIHGVPKKEIRARVEEMAKFLKVSHIMERLPKTMSGGERQRIALGRALIRTPAIFLLDEPLSSLDAMLRMELRAELKRLQRECGRTFLMATPDFTEALAVADMVVLLRQGSVVQMAPPQELYDKPVDREAALFVGAPQINLVAAAVDAGTDGLVRAAGAAFAAPEHLRAALTGLAGEFELGIRPENLVLSQDPDRALIRAEVTDVEPLGLKSVVTVANDACELRLMADSATALALETGQTAGLDIPAPERLLAFDKASGLRLGE